VWSENSPTESTFPFGFVQLAANRANYAGSEFPVIRWHQTADVGYVPNDAMPVRLEFISLLIKTG
jgi:sialate O-acetylesterase